MASTSDEASNHSDLLDQFCAVTGSDREKGEKMLEICGWNLEMAVNMQVDSNSPLNGTTPDFLTAPTIPDVNQVSLDSDGVRAPIPPTRGVLVEEDYSSHLGFRGHRRRVRSVFDGFRDFQAEARWQEELTSESVGANSSKKRKTLEDLFRPPLDLIHRGSFESARDAGQLLNKWLMVNVQDSQEFACQVLNRDVWSNQAVKSIVSEHFVFWQVYCDSAEGQRYIQFYKPISFPYIAIIDPRTGENIAVWNKMDSILFCDAITTFLNEHVITDGALPVPRTNQSQSIVDVSEEQQLKTAVEASLKEACVNVEDDNSSELETFDSDSEKEDNKTSNKENEKQCGDDELESWQAYLGLDEDEKTNLILRLPDGKRESVTWPCSSKMKALFLFSESLGFCRKKYELVTNFPRKNLCELPFDKSLKELGLYPREMIFVQLKNSI